MTAGLATVPREMPKTLWPSVALRQVLPVFPEVVVPCFVFSWRKVFDPTVEDYLVRFERPVEHEPAHDHLTGRYPCREKPKAGSRIDFQPLARMALNPLLEPMEMDPAVADEGVRILFVQGATGRQAVDCSFVAVAVVCVEQPASENHRGHRP